MNSKKESLVKIILVVFFLIFFTFIFWYFYQPQEKPRTILDDQGNEIILFPFGENLSLEERQRIKEEEERQKITKEEEVEIIPLLRQISDKPTAGIYFGILNKEELIELNKNFLTEQEFTIDDNISEIRYILSKNSHVYRTHTNTLKKDRISNITIPKIQEVLFFDLNNFIIRYLNSENKIKTYSIALKDKTEDEIILEQEKNKNKNINLKLKSFDGIFFPDNILEITKSPFNNEVFYLKKNENKKGVLGMKSGKFFENKKELKTFDFKEWNIQWVTKDKILFTSKPSKNTRSVSLVYNLKDNSFRIISQSILAGSSLANNDFSKILYSGVIAGKYTLAVYDIKENKRTILNTITLVDKCVWSKNNIDVYCAIPVSGLNLEQPDSWYRGYNNFTDNIFKINTELNFTELVYFRIGEEPEFDITSLKLDSSEGYLYWIDKVTDFAWSYRIF